jgi:hypothetical protein
MSVERASDTGSDGNTKKRKPDGFAAVLGTFRSDQPCLEREDTQKTSYHTPHIDFVPVPKEVVDVRVTGGLSVSMLAGGESRGIA